MWLSVAKKIRQLGGGNMKYTYRVRIGTVYNEEGSAYLSYGVEALNEKGEALDSVSDVFLNKDRAEQFVRICNRGELSLIHLKDAIEDAISE